jgi:flagellar basal body-associated protein FliL
MRGRIPGFLAVFAAALLLAASPAFAGGGGGGHGGGGGNKGKSSEFTAGEDGSRYITMAPMILPVLNDKGIEEIVSVVVSLEVKDQEKMEKVNRLVPKLKDAYMRALYGKLESKAYRNGQFLDINRLKIKITSVTHTIVGHGEVDDVLIQGVNQRHFN